MAPATNEPIAVIGSACRFPGQSTSPSKLWALLREPRDVLTKIPSTRFSPDGFYHENGEYHGSSNVTHSYLLSEDHRLFDAEFFKIKPVEAHCVDPQQRLLMETVYESLEAAGLTIEGMQGSDTAVYVGLMCEEYSGIVAADVDQIPRYVATATARSIMSNRISYFFDWHGPCMTIDTACSSSLVAVHQAVQTLRDGTSKVAVAAGSNLLLGPSGYITESKLHMLSPGSRSRMWDADADGYARGDGVATLVLKKLSDAVRDGDDIECVIRETAVNQDGRTAGITMPSSTAQEALIRSTYAKAGLDLTKPHERCQFFEAHGTGTPAGDPIEAAAIRQAFFESENQTVQPDDKLYVGSVKTVIGHTEGTAGIAAVMKASLAIQNATIPPNLLFNRPSPAVEPFYRNLEIATTARPWPTLPDGQPRRASVNSFGFGGTNAHAIIEQYMPEVSETDSSVPAAAVFLPFCISAVSEKSLVEQTGRLLSWLEENPDVNLADLAWTLSTRRSTFLYRWHFSASSVDQLRTKLGKKLDEAAEASYDAAPNLAPTAKKLGVFTGQGAQWATMAAHLIRGSKFVEDIVDRLEASLAALPDPPAWSLKAEMLADAAQSRMSEATLSQPACTAAQIILVDILRAAGLHLDAVVGHSSGEIGAAYAAGFLTAEDAIRIAYYRGVHSRLARGPNGEKGAMLAAGTSLEDAKELCNFEQLKGRISVAASNSSMSVTLSGDADAIQEAKEVMEDEEKFARLLRVDTAYHSHHMLPCAGPYQDSLRNCGIKIQNPASGPVWISSVTGEMMVADTTHLSSGYWRDNMVQPVFFSQAIQKAVESEGPFELAIEIGPHPALQGPALQTIQEVSGSRIPYTGTLTRGVNDVDAVADFLGYLWRVFAKNPVDLPSYHAVLTGGEGRKLIKGLPPYAFEHDRVYWQESRLSRTLRTRNVPYHELLGVPCPDGTTPTLYRWKNLLDPKEIPWLSSHAVQGQVIFPGAGSLSMVIDACRVVAANSNRTIRALDIMDFVIGKPIVFGERTAGVETLLALSVDQEDLDGERASNTMSGTARLYAGSAAAETTKLALHCSCRVEVVFGKPCDDILPPRGESLVNSVPVDAEHFYSHLLGVGYEYSGPFKGLSGLRRTLDAASGFISNPAQRDPIRSPTAHPAMLDCAIQAILLAFCYPGDGKLYAIHVPTRICRVSINLPLLERETRHACLLPVDCIVNDIGVVSGDIQVFAADGRSSILQVQGVEALPLSRPTPDDDSQIFFAYELGVALPDGELMTKGRRATEKDYDFAIVCERIAYHYLKHLLAVLTPEEIEKSEWHHKRLVNFARKALAVLQSGTQPLADPKWYHDTKADIEAMMEKYKHKVEITLARAVGEHLPAAVRGETVILEHMVANDTLNALYTEGMGFIEYSDFVAEAVAQLAHRYPHMNILEIGAGTGGATKKILPRLDKAFSSYTFTDISGGFFPNARAFFKEHHDCMTFKVLDIEKDVVEQGFKPHSYDVVVASLVLHATRDLEDTMRNVRRLLKPGGYIIMLELTDLRSIRTSFAMSGLPGWWLGRAEDGREFSPCVDANRWNTILQKTGFSSIDAITPDVDHEPWPVDVIVAQALDDRVKSLRRPLSASVPQTNKPRGLIIIGGATLQTSLLADEIEGLVSAWFSGVRRAAVLDELLDEPKGVDSRTAVLSLADLDSPVFRGMTRDRLEGLKLLVSTAKSILWLTGGPGADDPHMNMTIGFGRTAAVEMAQLRLQFLKFGRNSKPKAHTAAEALLRLCMSEQWEDEPDLNEQLLWTIDPELLVEDDRLFVPRLRATKDRNDRYNSTRRAITKDVMPAASRISIIREPAGYLLKEDLGGGPNHEAPGARSVTVRLSHSILHPLRLAESGSFYVSIGKVDNTAAPVLVLSKTLSSTLQVPHEWVLPCSGEVEEEEAGRYLQTFAGAALARYIVANAVPGTALVAHQVPAFLEDALSAEAAANGVSVHQTSSESASDTTSTGSSVRAIHPRTSARRMRGVLPTSASLYVDFFVPTTTDTAGSAIVEAFAGGAPCRVLSAEHLLGLSASEQPIQPRQFPELPGLISLASETRLPEPFKTAAARVVPLCDIPTAFQDEKRNDITVVSWQSSSLVPVRVENIDAQFSFQPDRTYVLFGLSGQLGRSICTWMARRGARCIVLTSRRPEEDTAWIRSLESLGAQVKVMANDITDRASVEALLKDIRSTMPPIAGVANGAMVLQDTPLRHMTLDILNRVLKPKVDGSRHLDELLRNDELDFFIFFSSLASVFGNHGQTNYTAANLYMNSVAEQRRKRGLPASVIAIGAVTGIGYMARELGGKELARITASGYKPMSERDLHLLFCEAIFAGRPESGFDYEVICGVEIAKPGDTRSAAWRTNPLLGHCTVKRGNGKTYGGMNDATLPVKTSLLSARTRQESLDMIKGPFIKRLQGMLQSETAIPLHLAADELGVDSLVAVDIRSWFLKELDVDLPVLKILGGASVGDMLEYVLENISPELIPNVDGESTPSEMNASESESSAVTPLSSATSVGGSAEEKVEEPDLVKASVKASGKATSVELIAPESSPGAVLDDASDNDSVLRSRPMSFGQSRFWFLQNYLEAKTAFNIVTMMTLEGHLRIEDLRRAVNLVASHHEGLRTKFSVDEQGQPIQSVLAAPRLALQHRDISGSPDQAAQEFERASRHIYDLERGDTMLVSLLSDASSARHYLTIGYHHINMDGISLGILLADLDKAYRGARLAPTLQYPDFSTKQRQAFVSGGMKDEIAFWRKELDTFPPPFPLLPFSLTTVRRPLTHYRSHKVEVTVDATLAAQIRKVTKISRVSPFHVYLAVFWVLLTRITGVDDIAIGMADANRTDGSVQGSIGMFLNLLPLRFRTCGQQSFQDAVKEAQSKVRKALAHSRIPFDALLEELKPPRSADAAPLFQTFIGYRQPLPEHPQAFGCKLVEEQYVRGDTAYDVAIDIIDTHEGDASIQLTVPELLYSASDVRVLMTAFLGLLRAFTSNTSLGLNEPPLFPDAEVQKAIQLGRGLVVDSKWKSLGLRIREVITEYRDLVAVRDGYGDSLTYGELDDKIRAVAHFLLTARVQPGAAVAVLERPAINWAVSVLAILRIGAVYVPLDARSPPERLALMVNDSSAVAIIVDTSTAQLAKQLNLGSQIGIINVELCENAKDGNIKHDRTVDPHDPAFILYTSGSTGVPKGVILTHDNLLNQIENTVNCYGVQPGWTVLQQTAYSFDISMWQLLVSVTSGASLYVVPQHFRGDPLALSRIIKAENINLTATTPSEYASWIRHGDREALSNSKWRVVNCGGEPLTPALQADFRSLGKPDLRLYNAYAPCEATFVSNELRLDYHNPTPVVPTPVGYTLPNYSVYILDNDLAAQPIGVAGQIAIGGAGVAAGYFGSLNQRLTAKSFVPNPFATDREVQNGWTTMYLTGDRGYLRDDGALVFVSRLSNSQTQVKVRGMRFDLQDVEANLVQTAGGMVTGAVVSLRGQGENQFLVAHVTLAEALEQPDQEAFCQELPRRLPLNAHMKPAVVIPLDKLPLTANAKVDRAVIQALPLPEIASVAPTDADLSGTERMLALWRSVLPAEVVSLKQITPDTDFFAAGGNSLLLIRLQGEIEKHFNVFVPLIQLFDTPSLGGMASRAGTIGVKEDNGPIDWARETELPQIDLTVTDTNRPRSNQRNIVLTGATGFLGRSIVRQLVENPSVERIDCIAVRNAESRTPKLPAIFSSPKVRIYPGDLTLPNLGLSDQDSAAVFSAADVVIHNAADISFLRSYRSLRAPNVGGTREIIKLAAPRQIPVHFVSSAGVANLADRSVLDRPAAFGATSVSAFAPPTDSKGLAGVSGYVAAKWASERLLERAHEQARLPVWIHRPSSIMGEGAPDTDLMANLLKYTVALQAVPVLQTGGGDAAAPRETFLDFVDVETAAEGIVDAVLGGTPGDAVGYSHHCGEYVIPLTALGGRDGAGVTAGNDGVGGVSPVEGMAALPLGEWTAKARQAGLNESVAALLNTTLEGRAQSGEESLVAGLVMFPRLAKGRNS